VEDVGGGPIDPRFDDLNDGLDIVCQEGSVAASPQTYLDHKDVQVRLIACIAPETYDYWRTNAKGLTTPEKKALVTKVSSSTVNVVIARRKRQEELG
jgi:hypothetical protein